MKRICLQSLLVLVLATTGANAQPGGAAVDVDLSGLLDDDGAADGQVMEVVATGTGLNPEQAKQNAFSAAIEQAVGVLVDAETLVANDEIVREQVLTFSRGFVEEFDVIGTWEQGGLHYARLRARVTLGKLAEKLQANKIAVRQVPGELLFRRIKHELVTEENAAEMVRKALADFSMDKLLKMDINGEPELVDKDETHARLRVRATVTPDLPKWKKLRRGLMPILRKVASKKSVVSTPRHNGQLRIDKSDKAKLDQRLSGDGVRLFVLKDVNPAGTVTTWDAFLVPEKVASVVLDVAETSYRSLHVVLEDEGDRPLGKAVVELKAGASNPNARSRVTLAMATSTYTHPGLGHWLSGVPLGRSAWHGHGYFMSMSFDATIELELEKLRSVDECVAYIGQQGGQ